MTGNHNVGINLPETAIPIPYSEIAVFCERYHIRKMWLFGSILREDFTSDSDVMVEFDPDHVPGWGFYTTWTDELSGICGHPVDFCTSDSLSK